MAREPITPPSIPNTTIFLLLQTADHGSLPIVEPEVAKLAEATTTLLRMHAARPENSNSAVSSKKRQRGQDE